MTSMFMLRRLTCKPLAPGQFFEAQLIVSVAVADAELPA